MAAQDKTKLNSFSPKDDEEAQKELDLLRKHLQKNGVLKTTHLWTGFQGKTLWDWLQLLAVLAIPLILGIATLSFGIQQANLAQQQHENDQKIANQQHEADKQSALDQQQATTLQAYIDNIQDLLLNHNLLKSKPEDDVAILARARTLTALQGLDSVRKGHLLTFLYEAKLIGFADAKGKRYDSIINLSGANLSYADLVQVDISGANLSYADLSHADLHASALSYTDFFLANLTGATFEGSAVIKANFEGAILGGANLSYGNLVGADFDATTLDGANFDGASLNGANFSQADLTQQQLDSVNTCTGAILPKGLICHNNQ